MALRSPDRNRGIARAAGIPGRLRRAAALWPLAARLLPALLACIAFQPLQAQEAGNPLPLDLPASPDSGAPASGEPDAGAELTRLKDALRQMDVQNPVVARVNGHDIRWAEVVASARDLPPRYREQIESVFPALLDRLVDLRLLADAARAEGLRDDPVVRRRLESFEDRILSSVLLERHLAETVTTAELRARYDALVAARRGDREIRARHIVVDSEAAAEEVIDRLDQGEVFISLATELSTGASASRGGDLGYFLPSRMPPAFAEAALALEPGDYTRTPVETEFGWHVILLVDRRADDIPSFLDMQDKLREEVRKQAVDRLVAGLRREASVEMFPEDAPDGAAGEAAGEAAAGEAQ